MKTILLAEDTEELRELMGNALAREGFKVVTAKNGMEALRLFKAIPGFRLPRSCTTMTAKEYRPTASIPRKWAITRLSTENSIRRALKGRTHT